MKQKYLKFLIVVLAVAIILPQVALAAWWNPFTSDFWNNIFHFFQNPNSSQHQTKNNISEDVLKNVILSYPNPYDASKTDSFTLKDGHAVVTASNGAPSSYVLAKTAIGDLDGDGVNDGAIAAYQGYGANIIVPVVFAVLNKNGILMQTDAVLPLNGPNDAEIKSLSISNQTLTIDLLVVSDKDMANLPHSGWKPSVEKTVQYKLTNGKLVDQSQVLLPDVYPFFSGAKWGSAQASTMNILNEGNATGYEILGQGQISDNKNSQDFFNYYKQKLTAAGWTEDNNAAADGILGGQRGYKKDNNRIVLNFNEKPGKVTSKKNEPMQWTCPCDMTYTIFTGTTSSAQKPNTPVVGGDRDAHGCIPSAGYTWCAAKQKCLRPWEEKCQ